MSNPFGLKVSFSATAVLARPSLSSLLFAICSALKVVLMPFLSYLDTILLSKFLFGLLPQLEPYYDQILSLLLRLKVSF